MGRITRYPPKPKTKFQHEVRVCHYSYWKTRETELWDEVRRIAGQAGFKKHTPFWAFTVVSFDTEDKAKALDRWLRRARFNEGPPPPASSEPDRYELAAKAQHAVIWGLSTGIIRDVVRTYRRERRACSTHGYSAVCIWWLVDAFLIPKKVRLFNESLRVKHMGA